MTEQTKVSIVLVANEEYGVGFDLELYVDTADGDVVRDTIPVIDESNERLGRCFDGMQAFEEASGDGIFGELLVTFFLAGFFYGQEHPDLVVDDGKTVAKEE